MAKKHLSEAEVSGTLEAVKRDYPRAWQHCHHEGDPERYDYIILAGRKLYPQGGGTVGCNWKRANVGDLSMDGLTVESPSNGRYYFDDVISGAGGSNPSISYQHPYHSEANLLRDAQGNYAPQGFANPMELKTHFDYGIAGGWSGGGIPVEPPVTPPTTPPAKVRTYPGDQALRDVENNFRADRKEANQPEWDQDAICWTHRPMFSYMANEKNIKDIANDTEAWLEARRVHRWGWVEEQGKGGWRKAMGLPPDPNRPL